ncbi:acylphosphatase [Candidatus Caldatribacterium sp.]|uniref:acylphosphatase n=1 Tax=Candidatus Caldatribacterium sp. TaxID=2282143 RepID=UPI002998167E|nr:acylphosphatase [Candidatus Calescibacterium sp.]
MVRKWVQGRLVLRGRVQGVGYRYFVLRKSQEFDVTGMVRNLPTGEVEVVAEGEEEEVRRFFEEVKKGPAAACVTSWTEEWFPFSGLYHDFRVGYY